MNKFRWVAVGVGAFLVLALGASWVVIAQQGMSLHTAQSQLAKAKKDLKAETTRYKNASRVATECYNAAQDWKRGLSDYVNDISSWTSSFPYGTLDVSDVSSDIGQAKAEGCGE